MRRQFLDKEGRRCFLSRLNESAGIRRIIKSCAVFKGENNDQAKWKTACLDIRTRSHIKDARPKKDARQNDCACVKEDRGRDSTEGF